MRRTPGEHKGYTTGRPRWKLKAGGVWYTPHDRGHRPVVGGFYRTGPKEFARITAVKERA